MPAEIDREFAQVLAQRFCDFGSVTGRSFGEHDDEFLAAVARDPIGTADFLPNPGNHGLQYGIARLVPMSIVDLLEMIDVAHQERKRMRIADATIDFMGKFFHE